jgi:hypothetical protein
VVRLPDGSAGLRGLAVMMEMLTAAGSPAAALLHDFVK